MFLTGVIVKQHSIPEKRQHPRLDNGLSLKISTSEGDIVTETSNISCSGLYCRVDRYLEPMTKLGILLLFPERKGERLATRKINCSGVVVRVENILEGEGFRIAVFFNEIAPSDRKFLTDFIEQAIARGNNGH